MADKKGGIALVFGALPKKKGGASDDARDVLTSAFPDWSDDQVDAMHEYIMSCMDSGGDEPDEDDTEAK